MEEVNQHTRILMIYQRLKIGEKLVKYKLVNEFNVSEKTLQRDFSEIKKFIAYMDLEEELVYNRADNYHYLKQEKPTYFSAEEILLLAKILLEARALPKNEVEQLVTKLLGLIPAEKSQQIKKIIRNEKFHYEELKQSKSVQNMLWQLANAIHTKTEIHIHYKKEYDTQPKVHKLQPVGVIFSDYYFYLIAFKEQMTYPIVFRLDRITECKLLAKKFKINEANRFKEGEFRKRVQFMYTGELLSIEFYFNGASLQAVLDRLPTAEVIGFDEEKGSLIRAEVYGTGIQMWLLSQGNAVEVMKPLRFREQMKEKLQKMLERYK
ncbi:MAG: WYL domain-containing protein [Kurthia sp.]|nr:WYL domain-containing protein [Candidatus Kurthia equi]